MKQFINEYKIEILGFSFFIMIFIFLGFMAHIEKQEQKECENECMKTIDKNSFIVCKSVCKP